MIAEATVSSTEAEATVSSTEAEATVSSTKVEVLVGIIGPRPDTYRRRHVLSLEKGPGAPPISIPPEEASSCLLIRQPLIGVLAVLLLPRG
ncbi:hypothetical protein AVEN_221811-1 [Araneus ventricosus]|uniref:Uncharacterized protein n=1 Tax=Araneus ventricosus TaxID=182803 RepID=A0A4Y2NSP2_ARAVE|nr:hypothetical protein AVEN_221811-1 [Araneus ventricosus]